MPEFNEELCKEKHKNIDENIKLIHETLKSINDKLDNKFVTKTEVKSSIGLTAFLMSICGFLAGYLGFKQ